MNHNIYQETKIFDNKNYSIRAEGTMVKITFKNSSTYKKFVDHKLSELDTFQLLPDFLENFYDHNLKQLILFNKK